MSKDDWLYIIVGLVGRALLIALMVGLLLQVLLLAGCASIEKRLGELTPWDCRYTGCNQGYTCIEGEKRYYCADGEMEEECLPAPKCPEGEEPEAAPYAPGACAWTGKCVAAETK